MPTIQCAVKLLGPGQETLPHRPTSMVIYHVYRGEGTSIIGGQVFQWRQGDSFVVPVFHQQAHANISRDTEAVQLSMSGAPVLKAFDLYRGAS